MQLLKENLDGSNVAISAMQFQATRQGYIEETIAASAESPGYHAICGNNLDAEDPSEQVFNVIASNGVLVRHNFPV